MRERRSNSKPRRLVALLAMVVVLSPGHAAAEESTLSFECPSKRAVAEAVRALLSQSHVELTNVESEIDVRDQGTTYRVAVRGRTRQYEDELRDCNRRARVSAVFVAMTLAPPEIDLDLGDSLTPEPTQLDPAPKVESPTPVAALAPANTVQVESTRWKLGVDVGATAAVAPRSHASPTTFGGSGRLTLWRRQWGWAVGGNVTTASELVLGTSHFRQLRVPTDIGLRWRWGEGALEGTVDAGLLLAWLRLQPKNTSAPQPRALVELGVRVAATLQFGRGPVRPYVLGFAEVIPVPREVAVEPRGPIGHSSLLWLGASVGVTLLFL